MALKNKVYKSVFLLLAWSTLPVCAQWTEQMKVFQQGEKKWIGGISNRTSYYIESPARITSIFAGIGLNDKLRLTASYHFTGMSNGNVPIVRNITYLPNGRITEDKSYKLRFFGLGAETVVYRKEHWQISVPLVLGLGRAGIDSRISTIEDGRLDVVLSEDKTLIVPLEGAATALYLVNEWLGFKGSIGNRIVIGKGDVNAIFSGPFWQVGMLVYPSPLYEKITGKPLMLDELFR